MLLNKEMNVSKDILAHLQDEELCDVKIVGTDGEIPANRTILIMRSQYFRSMFSSNNNFVERSTNTVKLPYSKAVLDKLVLYLYSGQLDCEEMALRPLLDLMELLNLINFAMEFSTVESFVINNIKEGKFPFSDCLKTLDYSSTLGLKTVGESLLAYLGENFQKIFQLEEVGMLSEAMIFRLLEEKSQCRCFTILRFRSLVTWLSVNSLSDDRKAEVLQTLDFNHFTTKQLASVVRQSGLYQIDQIVRRMEDLFELKEMELETLRTEKMEAENTAKVKETSNQSEIDLLKSDITIMKTSLSKPSGCKNKYGYDIFYWVRHVPSEVRERYSNY